MAEEKEFRKRKNPIKFQIQLNEEQKEAKSVILNSTITALTGEAGSGKTAVACQAALDLLFNGAVEKIILTRAAVNAGEEIGFLPGDKDTKLHQYVLPILENMYEIYNKEKIEKEIQEERIIIGPVGFMRGRNLARACVLIDEAQNLTHSQTKLLLTRVCHGTKVIMCGDVDQTDLPPSKQSGFDFICKEVAGKMNGFSLFVLKQNHRDPIVEDILKIYKEKGI